LLAVKKPWEILQKTFVLPARPAVAESENEIFTNWLYLLKKLRTFFQENPDFEEEKSEVFKRPASGMTSGTRFH
jgi:hypothetical protein